MAALFADHGSQPSASRCSYAVYRIPRICEALVQVADRGVSINVIIETPGPSAAARCSVFLWPLEKRDRDESGKPGILHVNCAVADGRWLFVSSANLTEYAFTLNMELGLLVTGGSLPKQVEVHFDRMIQLGVLTRI